MTGTQVAPVPAIIGGSNDIPPLKTPTLPIKSIESVHLRTSIAGTDNVIGVVHTSTFMNGSGDSKKLTKDMDKKEITVNGSKLGDSTPSNKLPQQTVSSSGTILKNDCIDLDKNFVAVDLKNLKDNSLLVNNLKSIGVGVRAPINASTLNGNTTQKMNTKAVNGTTFETDEDTSSSEHSSEDETERMLRAKWEREQVDIAWRWHWLDLQTRELQYQIQQADQQYLKLRRNKQPVVPPLEDFDTLRSLRTSSMGTLKKSRKLCRRAPTNLSGRIVEGAEPHPLFSFAERKASLRSSLAGSRDPGSPEISPPVKSEQPKRRRDSSRKREVKDVIKKEVEEDDVATRPNRKRRNTDDSPHSPVSPTTPLATPKMSEKKKKTLKTRDFDIDNVVIPFGMGSACSIPVIQYKEIITPKWRSVDAPDFDGKKGSRKRKALSPINTPEQSPLPSPKLSPMVVEVSTTLTLPASSPKVPLLQAPPFKRFSNSKNSKSPTTPNTPLENSQESVPTKTFSCVSENPPARFSILSDDQPSECTTGGEDSSDEDTSDEAFARRHMKQELTERQRYLLPKKKNAADAVANDTTITNLFVTSHDDLLSTYSPKPGGSLLPAELFTEPNNEDSTPTTPMDLSRSTTSLSVKKDKLKEKFAKMRHSMDDSQSEGHRVSRTSSAPSKLSSKSPKAAMPSGSETESEDSSEEDEEEEEEEEEGPEPPKKEEEEYVEGQKNKPVDGQKRRSRKFQPIRTRSRAKAMAVAAAAQAVQQKPQPKPKPPPTKKSTKKPAAEKSTPAPTPSPKSATMPTTTSSSPSTTTATVLVAESDDGYLSDEEDWDEWEASCDKNNKWWWEPAHWEVISEESAESAEPTESESQALFIRLYRTPIAACASVPSALDVPTPTFPGDATAEELAVAQTLKETPMAETTATETDAQKPTCTLSDSSLTLESSSTVEGPSVVSHSTLLAMEVDTQPADDIVMADTVHHSTAVEEVPTEKPMEEGPTRVNDVTTSVDEVIAIEVPTTISTQDADSAVDTTVDSIMDTTATDIDTSTDLDLSITCESKATTTTTTTTVFDVLPTTNENTAVPTNTNTFDTYTDAETPTHIPPSSEPQHPQPTMPAPTQQQSSPPTTPPQLIASPDDDILLISPLRSDSDDYTLLPHSHPPSHSHTHTPPSPSHLPSLDTRDNIVFPAHHNNPVE